LKLNDLRNFQLEGCRNKKNATFYVGKRCVFVYKGKNKTPNPTNRKQKNTIRAIWGKVTRTHGDNGCVRAKFKRNLPGYAIGRRVRIVSSFEKFEQLSSIS
jgi:large subunit ribosomal protein L35Ae